MKKRIISYFTILLKYKIFIALFLISFSYSLTDVPYVKKNLLKFKDLSTITFYKYGSKPSIIKDSVIILLDSKTDETFNYSYPYDYNVFQKFLDIIISQEPLIFAIDLTFTSVNKNANANNLADFFRIHPKIVLVTYIQSDNTSVYNINESFRNASSSIGIISKNLDSDGIIRSLSPQLTDPKTFKSYICAEALLAMKYYNIPDSNYLIDVDNNYLRFISDKNELNSVHYGDSPHRLDFKIFCREKDLQTISFADVYNNKLPQDFLKNKLVFLGRKSPIYHDIHNTAMGRELGIILFYNSFLTFITNNFPSPIPYNLGFILSVFLFYLYLNSLTYFQQNRHIFIAFLFVVLSMIAHYVLYYNNLKWNGLYVVQMLVVYSILNEISYYFLVWQENIKIKNSFIIDNKSKLHCFSYFIAKIINRLKSKISSNEHSFLLGLFIQDLKIENEINNDFYERIRFIGKELSKHLKLSEYVCWNEEKKIFYFLINEKSKSALIKRIEKKFIEKSINNFDLKYSIKGKFKFGVVNLSEFKNFPIIKIIDTLSNHLLESKTSDRISLIDARNVLIDKDSEDISEQYKIFDSDAEYIANEMNHSRKNISELEEMIKLSTKDIAISQKLASVGKVAAEVAHELKNPLQNLVFMSEILKKYIEEGHPAHKHLKTLKNETQRMVKLCRQMLSFSKPSENKKQPSDLNFLVQDTLDFLEGSFRKKNINVTTNLQKDMLPLNLEADKIKQVLLNMIMNSIDAMKEHGNLYIETITRGSVVQISINDDGEGIPKENLDKIFNLFFTTKGDKGTGFGLSTCFEIIKNHDGRILVESEVDKGATFKILLPI